MTPEFPIPVTVATHQLAAPGIVIDPVHRMIGRGGRWRHFGPVSFWNVAILITNQGQMYTEIELAEIVFAGDASGGPREIAQSTQMALRHSRLKLMDLELAAVEPPPSGHYGHQRRFMLIDLAKAA